MLSCNRISFAVCLIAFLFVQNVYAETITVGNITGLPGETVRIPVTLDAPGIVQGAAFTVYYDSEYLTLTGIEAPFFKNFEQQFSEMANSPDPALPSQVVVDSVSYVKPLIVNPISGGVMLAAVQIQSGGDETALFILEFQLAANTPDGAYPVSVSTSFIKNIAAGYPVEGIGLPLLFPVSETVLINGMVSVNFVQKDIDNDGIDDDWEISRFGNLTTASNVSDFDKDGYTDLQEYHNWLRNLLDSKGNVYNPKVKNSAGEVGYHVSISHNSFWIMMMPVLMGVHQ